MDEHRPESCDCYRQFSRRRFLKTSAAAAGAAIVPGIALPHATAAKASQPLQSETLVKTLYQSLTDAQKGKVCFDFDHRLRHEIDNNWFVVRDYRVRDYSKDQQAMIREIFMKMHSEEYADQVMKQVLEDSGRAGFGECSIALFGKPDTGKFQFVLTGRHTTRRCDGDSVEGTAFGGPIFYGHAAQSFYEKPHHPGNVYWYQAQRANAVYQMMDGKQRAKALMEWSRDEQGKKTVALTGKNEGLDGIRMTELSTDQKNEVRKTLDDLLLPFREADRRESLKLIEESGFDNLHLAFYKGEDVGDDGVWDVFQIEGPNMVWYFRGDPHVHSWVHIKDQA